MRRNGRPACPGSGQNERRRGRGRWERSPHERARDHRDGEAGRRRGRGALPGPSPTSRPWFKIRRRRSSPRRTLTATRRYCCGRAGSASSPGRNWLRSSRTPGSAKPRPAEPRPGSAVP